MTSLNDLGLKYRTDKGSDGKRGEKDRGHNYLETYEKFLPKNRQSVTSVLEVGVQRGASLRMWRDFFPEAQIYGIDIAETARLAEGPRISVHIVDQSDDIALAAFASKYGPFDLIVEDGSHIWRHQIITLQTLLRHVKPGGLYIVEDLHTSFSPEFGAPGEPTGNQYVLSCCQKVLGAKRVKATDPFLEALDQHVESVIVTRNAAIFCRR